MPHAGAGAEPADRKFQIGITHHPSHFVPDLGEAEEFFDRVFGRPSVSIDEVLKRVAYVRPDFPRSYAAYTLIGEVFFDSMDASRLVVEGGRNFSDVRHPEPHLETLGWYVENQAEAYRALRGEGFTIVNTIGEKQEGAMPTGPNDPAPFFTVRNETGMVYEFYPAMVFPCDPRTEPGWVVPPVSAADPLGIERCSHHTFLTDQPDRAKRILVDILGGELFHAGRDELLDLDAIYIRIGDSTLEFATPVEGTPQHEDWAVDAPNDTYHSITWMVASLERAEKHLESHGIGVERRSGGLVTDPATSLGIPWGFSETLVDGDPRPLGQAS